MNTAMSCYLVYCAIAVPFCILTALWIEGVRKRPFEWSDVVWYVLAATLGLLFVRLSGSLSLTWGTIVSPVLLALNCLLMYRCLEPMWKLKDKMGGEDMLPFFPLMGGLMVGVVGWSMILRGDISEELVTLPAFWPLWGPYFVLGTLMFLGLVMRAVGWLFGMRCDES